MAQRLGQRSPAETTETNMNAIETFARIIGADFYSCRYSVRGVDKVYFARGGEYVADVMPSGPGERVSFTLWGTTADDRSVEIASVVAGCASEAIAALLSNNHL